MRCLTARLSGTSSSRVAANRHAKSRAIFALLALGWTAGLPQVSLAEESLKPRIEERLRKSTLWVITYQSKNSKNDSPQGSGSGYFINSTGLLITNNHVVDPMFDPYDQKSPEEKHRFHYEGGKLSWTVTSESGTPQEKTYDAYVIYQNEQADQALLQAYDKDGKLLSTPEYLRFQPHTKLHKRLTVWGAGFPGATTQGARGKNPAVQVDLGNATEMPQTPGGRIRRVYTDVVARPGNSGGPQIDQDGLVVGTCTLMSNPPGREDQGGARYSALVPAALSADMIRNAYRLNKIPPGTDFLPFLDFLSEQSGRIDLPEFARRSGSEVLYFSNGDRVYGKFIPKEIKLETELGSLSVPSNAIAYLMTGDGNTIVHLEGGNRISVAKLEESFAFEPDGGSKLDVKYTDVKVISFRTEGTAAKNVVGKVTVVDGNLCRLLLTNIEGVAKFTGAAGTVDVKLEDIDRIESTSGGDRTVTLRDERRMTGKFEPQAIKAVVAATGTPVEIQLGKLDQGSVETRFLTGRDFGGLELVGIVGGRADFKRIAQTLESNTPEAARASIDKLMDKAVFNKLPTQEKDQLRLLDAVALLRTGKYPDAMKGFRSVVRSEDKNVAVFANAYVAVLRKNESGQYDGKPLSDRLVFADAGAEIARTYVKNVRDAIKEMRTIDGDKKNDMVRVVNLIKNNEETVAMAGVFLGTVPEDLMLRMWKIGQTAAIGEFRKLGGRISDFYRIPGEPAPRPAPAGGPAKEMYDRQKKAIEAYVEYIIKRYEYGFFIEDVDIEEYLAKEAEQES